MRAVLRSVLRTCGNVIRISLRNADCGAVYAAKPFWTAKLRTWRAKIPGSYLLPAQKSFFAGRTCFGTAALTVNIGSFTTWLNLRFIATLQRIYAWTSAKPQRATSRSIMREVAARAAATASVRRFDHDPGLALMGFVVCRGDCNRRACQCLALMQLKSQRHVRRAFDAIDADFAVALRRMGVPAENSAPRFSTGR